MSEGDVDVERFIETKQPRKMPQATSIDKPMVREAYEDVRSNSTDTQWAIFKFDGSRIVYSGRGNGFDKFKKEFRDNERAFGYIVLETGDELSKRKKFIFVTWIGPDVSVIQRAKMSTDKAIVKDVLNNFAVELQAESQLDLDLEVFTDALSRAGGANYGTGVRDL